MPKPKSREYHRGVTYDVFMHPTRARRAAPTLPRTACPSGCPPDGPERARALPLPPLCRRNFGWLGSCSRFGIGNVRARVRSRLAHTRSTVHRQPTPRPARRRPGERTPGSNFVPTIAGRRAGNLCVALPSVALPCVRDTGAPRSPTPTLGLNCIALHLHFPHHFVRASMCGSGSGIAVLRRGGKQTIIGRGDGDRLATN